MSGPDTAHAYAMEPLPQGGWRVMLCRVVSGTIQAPDHAIEFPADHRTDPTGEAAYEQALREAEAWRRQSPAAERRVDADLRNAIMRLRLAEFRSADFLPGDQMQELTAAIDALVKVLRNSGDLPPRADVRTFERRSPGRSWPIGQHREGER